MITRTPTSLSVCLLVACLGLLASPNHARADPPELLTWFNQVTSKAEAARQSGGAEAALAAYEEALLEEGYGRVHMSLGQIKQEMGRFAEAAAHYRDCSGDERVDALDRKIICDKGFEACTAPLNYSGLPKGGQVALQLPTLFAGPLKVGQRVPRGLITVVVEAPGREPASSELNIKGPTNWPVALGPRRTGVGSASDPDGVAIPDGFVVDDPDPPEGGGVEDSLLPWPVWAAGSAGVLLLGGGFYLGFNNRADLDNIRDRQSAAAVVGRDCAACVSDLSDAEAQGTLADGLWISGALITAGAVALWYFMD